MKNVLSLTAKEAREFFLKQESYFNFDLPPYFDFTDLLDDLSKEIGDKPISDFYNNQSDKPRDLEEVNYKMISNKDGRYAWRPLQIIHPALYVYLVKTITTKDNWKYIKDRLSSLMKSSRNIDREALPIVSNYYKKDKAAQIIHWSTEVEKKSIINSLDFDYLYHTDITDCYGSLYTHTISWALHDKVKAKKERSNKTFVGNQIDWLLQSMSNGQTNGIPQGSVLMDFLAEIVLCYVDNLLSEKIKNLKKNDYKIIRYRDDYRVFTNNPQIAEKIIKELTDILNDFGMKINSLKTKGDDNVIYSSIKSDKLNWIIRDNSLQDLYSELLAISVFSKKFPNSGQVSVSLKKFYDKILPLTNKTIKTNVKVLISIIVDLAYKNPRTYPISAAIISKLIDLLSKREREIIVKRILNKFKKLPNTGIMQIWLQRITIKIGNNYDYTEKLCNKVYGANVSIWNSDWLNNKLQKMINSYEVVDKNKLEELGVVIGSDEVELFKVNEFSL